MSGDEQTKLLGALTAEDFDGSAWAPADRVLIEYADKLTRTPGAISASDVGRLRAVGFDDRAIHDACAIVGYSAFVNRIADGLGVEPEDHAAS
ncbi:MAG TPA: hypothetical protein VEY91_13295 [Candidatus Limnocylindria bacterium]|nr:hypothetical protein [Candidatus Limnocylindria bacterium]